MFVRSARSVESAESAESAAGRVDTEKKLSFELVTHCEASPVDNSVCPMKYMHV